MEKRYLHQIIHEAFVEMSFMGYLNLSNNNLSSLTHLNTFGASSFLRDSRLSGTQVQGNCSDIILILAKGTMLAIL